MSPALVVLVACINPVAYGAKPGDGISDTAAIQQAIDAAVDAHQDVCLPEGTFDLDRPGPLASLSVTRGPLTIRGAGAKTILQMNGDGGRADWYAIYVHGATDVTVEDLALQATKTQNTKEQTHLIEIGPGSHDVRLDRLHLGPMRRADQGPGTGAHGDCVKILGEADAPVEDVTITNSDFDLCDRSGITVQRGIRRMTVAHDEFHDASDAAIDFEPTAPGPIEDLTFYDLTIDRSASTQGSWAMSITGYKRDLASRVVVSHCRMNGGGIVIIDAEHVLIDDDQITQTSGTYATVFTERHVRDLVISHDTIERKATAAAGPVVQTIHANGKAATHVRIVDDAIIQDTDAPAVSLVSASDVEVARDMITYAGGAGRAPAVEVSAVIDQVDDISIEHNQIDGPVAAAVHLYAHRAPIGRIAVEGNHAPAAARSVVCTGATDRPFRAPVRMRDNDFGGAKPECEAIPP